MKTNSIAAAAGLIFFFSAATTARAGEAAASTDTACKTFGNDSEACKKGIDISKVHDEVPDSPGFAIIGATPEKVVRPGTPKDLATQLINGLDANGNLQTGLAIDFNPYMLVKGPDAQLQDYQDSGFVRFLSNSSISLATAKGMESEDKSAKLGLGFLVTPWIRKDDDPRRNETHLKCTGLALVPGSGDADITKVPPAPGASKEERDKYLAEINAAAKAGVTDCRKKWTERGAAVSAWSFGIAPAWTSKDGNFQNLSGSGFGAWSSFSINVVPFNDASARRPTGLEGKIQFTAHVRYREAERLPHPTLTGTFFRQNTLVGAGELRLGQFKVGSGNDLIIVAEGDFIRAYRALPMRNDSYYQYSVGGSYKVSEKLWLNVSIGGQTKKNDGNNSFVMAKLKMDWSDDPAVK